MNQRLINWLDRRRLIGRPTAARSFLGTSATSVLVALLTFLSGVLVARTLSPDGRGEYGAVLLIVQTTGAVLCLSFFDGAIVTLRRSPGRLRPILPTMFAAALVLSIAISILLSIWLLVFQPEFSQITPVSLVLISSLVFVDSMLWQCFSACERSQMHFLFVNIARLVSPATYSLLIVLGWFFQQGDLSLTLVLWMFVIGKLPMQIIWFSRYRRYLLGSLSLPFVRRAGGIGLRLHMAVALGTVSSQLDRLIAIGAWSPHLLGQYFVAYSAVGAGFSIITSAVSLVLFPYFSGLSGVVRTERVSFIIRMTVVSALGMVFAGLLILPFAIPFLYGEAYLPARTLSIGLLFALSLMPLREVIHEAVCSLGRGYPSVEMALSSSAVMLSLFFLTKFQNPYQLIVAVGLANLVSMLVGFRHLVGAGVVRIGQHLIPRPKDVVVLYTTVLNRLTGGGQKDSSA